MLGAICGDILGSSYEFSEQKFDDIFSIELINKEDHYTDDTVLALATAEWLLDSTFDTKNEEQQKNILAHLYVDYTMNRYRKHELGYGSSYISWCVKAELIGDYSPYNSFGNGSAMRVSPVGWYFDSLEKTLKYAKLSASVTHNHPEGEKGAMATAAAIYMARNGSNKKKIKKYISDRFGYDLSDTVASLRGRHKWNATCQGSVPEAITAFLESTDFESTVRLSISYGGDSDTIAAIAGSIAEAFYKHIPDEILSHCLSRLDANALTVCRNFNEISKLYDTDIFKGENDHA